MASKTSTLRQVPTQPLLRESDDTSFRQLLDRLKDSEAENRRLIEQVVSLKRREEDQDGMIRDLVKVLVEIKLMHGLLPICAACKKIRDDGGSWNLLESYITTHAEVEFTHGLCPECERSLYPQLFRDK